MASTGFSKPDSRCTSPARMGECPPHFHIHTRVQELDGVGGDLVDIRRHANGVVSMTLADITGHGREAAGYARRLRGLLAGLEHRGCNQRAWLRRLNHRLCVLFDDEHLCAAIHARMRWVARRSQLLVSVANAGMPAPIVYHAATGTVSQLAFGAPPLGAFSESDRLPQAHLCTLEPGDALVLFSDGLTEARGPDRDFFGDQRIADVVRSLGPANGDVVLRGLSGAVAHFIGDRRMNDDLAMVAVHVPLAQAPFASSIAA